jgi:hypothetical protein
MATLAEIQESIDNKTFDPSKLNSQEKRLVDEAISRGLIKSPSLAQIQSERLTAARDIATLEQAEKDPIGLKLQQDDSFFKGRPTAVLAGDLTGSIAPYVLMRKKIFSAAKSKVPGDKYTGLFGRTTMFRNMATNLTNKLPGRFKFIGGALNVLAKAADPTIGRVLASPLGKAEIYSVLGGTAGAGAGSITYDMLNETAGAFVLDAIQEDLKDMTPREVKTNMFANAADATHTAFLWNAGAATLAPFIFSGLGKLGRLALGAKSKDAKELVEIGREKGFPVPMVSTAREGVGLLGGIIKNFFKVAGVFPFVGGLGREAMQGAEQIAGKKYTNQSVLTYGPILKTGMLSASVAKQAEEAFKLNSAAINAGYRAFDTLADQIGNPQVIPLKNTKEVAKRFIDEYRLQYPGLSDYVGGAQTPVKDIQALLQGSGDPLNLFFRGINAYDDFVTPKGYKGIIQQLNKAIDTTQYENIRASLWAVREGLENDLNSFGGNLTKETFLKDAGIKSTYDGFLQQGQKELAENFIKKNIDEAEKLKNKLYRANDQFSTLMNFYQRANVSKFFKSYDSTRFTNKALAGIRGVETKKSQKFFTDLANDVFTKGDEVAVSQLQQLLGAKAITSARTGAKFGQPLRGGTALYDAARAKWFFNAFYKSYDVQNKSLLREIMGEAEVATGSNGLVDTMSIMSRDRTTDINVMGFDLSKVKNVNGIYDTSKIRFSPREAASFDINKFNRNLGIGDKLDDVGRNKLIKILGGREKAKDFEKFITYMDAISNTPVADTSTFMARRFQLGGLGSLAGAVALGGSAAINPFAPALFILLARRAGQIFTDPVAMRAMNDALNPDEQVQLLLGKKIGDGVPGLLGIGKKYFKGRDIQTAVDILRPGNKGARIAPLARLGLTQKREAFARLMNYLHDSDSDVPRVNPKTVTPEEITERLLQLDVSVPEPIYDEKTIPRGTFETLFVENYSGSSGNINIDNDAFEMLQTSVKNENVLNNIEAPIEVEEATKTEEDLTLENPFQGPVVQGQQPQVPQAPQPPQGQVTAEQVQTLFPFDSTAAAIAQRRQNRG